MTTLPARDPSRVTAVAVHWWDAVSGGRFFTGWTLLASGIVAVGILSPYTGLIGVGPHIAAMVASLLAWAIIVLLVIPAAIAERRLTSRGARGAMVIVVLALVSVGRPFLNDAVAAVLFGHESTDEWLQRIATNALSWFALLPLVAVAGAWYADARDSAGRLAGALAVFDDLRQRVSRYAQQNSALLAIAVADVRRRRDALLAGHIDFDAVRDFADDVRAASHRLDERLGTRLEPRGDEASLPTEVSRGAPAPFLARLGRPHPALVILLYYAASTPYTFALGGTGLVAAALVILLLLAAAADLVIRFVGRDRTPVIHGAVVLGSWMGAGILMVVAGSLLTTVDGVILVIPLVTIPSLAVVVALSADALQRTRAQGRTLTDLLARTATLATAQTAHAREPLWRAVDLLHDRVQSRCVIFAARVDETPPTTADIDRFRRETDAALDEILAGSRAGEAADLDGLLATWSGVLDVHAEIDQPAVVALQSPGVASAVVAAVGEGFVNAVKHSAARAVWLTVVTAADESSLTVSIASRGTLSDALPDGAASGIGIASFGDRARLQQDGDRVVLEVVVPIAQASADDPDGSQRRWRPPTTTVRLP